MIKTSAVKTSLFSAQEREAKLNQLGDVLQQMNAHVDFGRLAKVIESKLNVGSSSISRTKGGRPSYPIELMVRILCIQQLYKLSDDAMEYQLLDRCTFQRFCGLEYSASIPDAKTIWHFKERLRQARGADLLFSELNQQLKAKGYRARGGQLIDATLIPSPIQHHRKADKAELKAGQIPKDWTDAKRSQTDLDASWTKKHSKSYHGYKQSLNVDHKYKFIRKVHHSSANEHDSLHLEKVLDNDNSSKTFTVDKGYENKERERRLQAEGWRPQIQRKAKKGKLISATQKHRNRRLASPRARVEHVFATLSQMGGKGVRCIGLERVDATLTLRAMAYNLKRLCFLERDVVG